MANNDYIAPVDHGFFSASGRIGGGILGGGLKSGLIVSALWTAAVATGGFFLAPVLGFGALGATVLTIGGGLVGLGSSWLPGGIAAIVGGYFGGSRASERVQMEQSLATQAKMQAALIRAQAMSQSYDTPARTSPDYGLPEQGTQFNAAGTKLYAANDNAYANEATRAQTQGTVAAQQQVQQGK